jgi:hypothetical protein
VIEQFSQVALTVDLEAVRHDFACQAVASEESLHAVSNFHFFGKHVPQQLIQEVFGIKQIYKNSSQLILQK